MINAQKELLKAGGSVLALAGLISKFRAKFNEDGNTKAKKSYSKTATVKKQNSELAKKQIEAIEQKELAKEAPKEFGIESLITAKNDEQKIAEEKVTVKGFGELVSAEKSETKIPANDPDVQGLIKVKEKSVARSLGASKAAQKRKEAYARMQKISGEPNIKPEDYEFKWDITDKELKKAGYTKTDMQELAVKASFDPEKVADELGISDQRTEWTKDDIEAYLKEQIRPSDMTEDYDKYTEEKVSSGEWYDTFSRENNSMSNTYKVWQDESEEDLPKVSRDFSGFVF